MVRRSYIVFCLLMLVPQPIHAQIKLEETTKWLDKLIQKTTATTGKFHLLKETRSLDDLPLGEIRYRNSKGDWEPQVGCFPTLPNEASVLLNSPGSEAKMTQHLASRVSDTAPINKKLWGKSLKTSAGEIMSAVVTHLPLVELAGLAKLGPAPQTETKPRLQKVELLVGIHEGRAVWLQHVSYLEDLARELPRESICAEALRQKARVIRGVLIGGDYYGYFLYYGDKPVREGLDPRPGFDWDEKNKAFLRKPPKVIAALWACVKMRKGELTFEACGPPK